MQDTITIVGTLGTPPKQFTTSSGLTITSFRLSSSQRRFDRVKGEWIDGETNWYTVSAFRRLAENTYRSLNRGDRVLVSGRLKIRPWENGTSKGTSVEIDAEAIGHDLTWGTTVYSRSTARSVESVSVDGELARSPDQGSGENWPSSSRADPGETETARRADEVSPIHS